MSSENANEGKKRRIVSIPFLIIVVILGLIGYFKGEEIMTYTMYLQEQWSHDAKVAEDQRYDELIGPPTQGDYGWVAPPGKTNESTATASPDKDASSEPPAATDLEGTK